jgi:hypothetical protein
MKVSFRTAGVAGGYTAVFSEFDNSAASFDSSTGTGAAMPEWSPQFESEVQEESTAFGAARFRQPRENVKASIEMTFQVGYASRVAAKAAVRTWQVTFVNELVHLKVEEGSGAGADTEYFPNAVATRYRAMVRGADVTHSISFESDDAQLTDPTP